MNQSTRVRLAAQDKPCANLYGPNATRQYGTITHADRFGTDLALRSKVPPPVSDYNLYLAGRNVRARHSMHGVGKTGAKLRRIVIMRREGCGWKECGEAIGVTGTTARDWVDMLPRELAI